MAPRTFLGHLEGMVERKLLRRVAAILFHRRPGFSANGMGVWRVPEDQILEVGGRMAAVRGISHCYQRPTYATGPTRCSRWRTGAPRRSATRSSTGSPRSTTSTARTARCSTPRPSSRRCACATSPTTTREWEARARDACARLRAADRRHDRTAEPLRARGGADAGRGQLPGSRHALDRPRPPDLRRARRGLRAHRRRRQPLRRLGVLLGPADPRPRSPAASSRPSRDAAARGTSFGAPTEGEVELAAEVVRALRARWRWCGWSTRAPRRR